MGSKINSYKQAAGQDSLDDLAVAVEQSNYILTTITYSLPLMFFIAANDTKDVLFANYAATGVFSCDRRFAPQLLKLPIRPVMEFKFALNGEIHYYTVTTHSLLWKNVWSTAYVIHDVSDERSSKKKVSAYQDPLTGLDNRLSGIMTLNKWLDSKSEFIVCITNLDNIKYINNTYGHQEGDRYIVLVAGHLSGFSPDFRAFRMGGDEFLLLIPHGDPDRAEDQMHELRRGIRNEIAEKPYYSNISYGLVKVGEGAADTASEILCVADARMQESKLASKQKQLLDI